MYFSSFPNYSTSTRPHRVSRLTFLIYSLDLLHKVTYIFWALTCLVVLPSYTAFVSSSCTSSHDFDTHFLHFHLTVDSLCFSIWLAISTSITDLHRLAKRHACRTTKNQPVMAGFLTIYFYNLLFFYKHKLLIFLILQLLMQLVKNFQFLFLVSLYYYMLMNLLY